MHGQPAADPQAVWTFVQAGEEIAAGDPSVTNQQPTRPPPAREGGAERHPPDAGLLADALHPVVEANQSRPSPACRPQIA